MRLIRQTALLFILLLLAITGCKSHKTVSEEAITTRDSVSVVTTLTKRDTIVTTPADSLRVQIPIKDLTQRPRVVRSARGTTTATISRIGDDIAVQCKCDSLKLTLEIRDRELEILRIKERMSKTEVVVPEKYIPWYTKILAWIGGIALAIGGVLGLLKFLKPI